MLKVRPCKCSWDDHQKSIAVRNLENNSVPDPDDFCQKFLDEFWKSFLNNPQITNGEIFEKKF